MNQSIAVMAVSALSLFADTVDQIPTSSWDRPSNLEGWTVRDLVGHATGSATKIVTLVEDGEIWAGPSKPHDWVCDDPAARLRELTSRLREVLPGADFDSPRTSPAGEVPLSVALNFPVADLVLHSWDTFRSLGRRMELPDDLLAFCRGLVDSVPESVLRRPGAFGPAQSASENATPTALLMAHLGRSVDDLSSIEHSSEEIDAAESP